MVVPVSPPVARTTSSMSLTMALKSDVASGWKTIAAVPRLTRSSSVSNVTYAVVIANSRSGAGLARSRLPRMTSRKPTPGLCGGGKALELGLEALQRGDALLDRRVTREDRADPLGPVDVEGLELLGRAQ